MLEIQIQFDYSVLNSVFMTGLNQYKLNLSVQYEGRIVGVGTSARGGTPGKPLDATGVAETPGIMRCYYCAATLRSRQKYTHFQHSRQ